MLLGWAPTSLQRRSMCKPSPWMKSLRWRHPPEGPFATVLLKGLFVQLFARR